MGELAQAAENTQRGAGSFIGSGASAVHPLVALPASGFLCLFSGWLGGSLAAGQHALLDVLPGRGVVLGSLEAPSHSSSSKYFTCTLECTIK